MQRYHSRPVCMARNRIEEQLGKEVRNSMKTSFVGS
jgi:hypothetical protein